MPRPTKMIQLKDLLQSKDVLLILILSFIRVFYIGPNDRQSAAAARFAPSALPASKGAVRWIALLRDEADDESLEK